jgi:hypothetical protein
MPPPSSRKNNVVPISRPKRAQAAAQTAGISHADIARRAYEIYEARARTGGSPLEDWVLAEQQLTSPVAPAAPKAKRAPKAAKAPR